MLRHLQVDSSSIGSRIDKAIDRGDAVISEQIFYASEKLKSFSHKSKNEKSAISVTAQSTESR